MVETRREFIKQLGPRSIKASIILNGLVNGFFLKDALADTKKDIIDIISDAEAEQHPAYQFYSSIKKYLGNSHFSESLGMQKNDGLLSIDDIIEPLNKLATSQVKPLIDEFIGVIEGHAPDESAYGYEKYFHPQAITRKDHFAALLFSYNHFNPKLLHEAEVYQLSSMGEEETIPIFRKEFDRSVIRLIKYKHLGGQNKFAELRIIIPPESFLEEEKLLVPYHNLPVKNHIVILDAGADGLRLEKKDLYGFNDDFHFSGTIRNGSNTGSSQYDTQVFSANMPFKREDPRFRDEQVRRLVKANMLYERVLTHLIEFYKLNVNNIIKKDKQNYIKYVEGLPSTS